jgi:tetratricopeptide (TPR) repeat protein
MKRALILFFLLITVLKLSAQTEDLQLAQQFTANGEFQKANDIYLKLYKQNSEAYYSFYLRSLLSLKKFDDAESITKKMLKQHPKDYQYPITLARVYHERGNQDKADNIYNELLKNLPADQGEISSLATQFYQLENLDLAIKVFEQGRKLLHSDQVFSSELISLYRFKRDKVSMVNEYINLLQTNPEYIFQAKSAMSTTFENAQDYNMLKTALLKIMQQKPQLTIFADLLTWQFLQQKQFDMALNQALALSRRLNDGGSSVYELCQTLTANQAYDDAIRGYEYIVSKGKEQDMYIPAKIEMINTKNLKITSGKYTQADLLDLEKNYIDLLEEFGRSNSTAFAMQKLAKLQAFKLHKTIDAQKLLEQAINIPGLRPNVLADCKLDLGDMYLLNGKPWEATLIYSQVEKDFPGTNIGQEATYRNAKLAYYTGDFAWAKGQLNVLKAATSQLIANDALNLSLLISDHTTFDSTGNALKMYARADMLIFKEDPDKAVITLDSIDKAFPQNTLSNDILMAKARILIQKNDYQAAIIPLKKIADDHKFDLWADDAVFMLGDIYENHLDDKKQAQMYYQKIITDYASSLWLNEARKRFRTLRGDLPPSS